MLFFTSGLNFTGWECWKLLVRMLRGLSYFLVAGILGASPLTKARHPRNFSSKADRQLQSRLEVNLATLLNWFKNLSSTSFFCCDQFLKKEKLMIASHYITSAQTNMSERNGTFVCLRINIHVCSEKNDQRSLDLLMILAICRPRLRYEEIKTISDKCLIPD